MIGTKVLEERGGNMDYVKELIDHKNTLPWLAVLLCTITYFLLRKSKCSHLPPGPSCFPIVGYLPFLGKFPHLTLYELSKKYGDVYRLKLGETYVVVVTDLDITRELFNKPSTTMRSPHVFHMMPDGVGLASLNGPDWVEQRRFTVMQMKNLGFGRSSWEKLVQDEVQGVVDHLSQCSGRPVDIFPELSQSMTNNILSLATGLPAPEGDVITQGIDSFMEVHNQSGILSFYPGLFQLVAKLGLMKIQENLKDLVKMNKYVRSTVEELKKEQGESYVHIYLEEIKKNKKSNLRNGFNESNLFGNMQALIIGGSHTTTVSLQWLLLAMAASPDIQDKVHQELDSVIGKDQSASWVDRERLPYCHATILEGQRWRTVAPLNLLHTATEDTIVGEYIVPKGTDILALIWAFHNDPRQWEDPEVFRPERFLEEDGQVVKKLGSYAPFSVGKRVCTGEKVAYIEIFLYFVSIMQKFRILPGSDDIPLNLEGISALAFHPHRQELRYIPR